MKVVVIAEDQVRLNGRTASMEKLAGLNGSVSGQLGTCKSVGAIADAERPDLIVLESICQTSANLADIDIVERAHPELAFIVVGATSTPEFLKSAMSVGVREVIDNPADEATVAQAVRRVGDKFARSGTPTKATVLVFLPCKGGSGATFLGANIAYMLASEYGKRTALIDLDLSVGDAAFLVSEQPGQTTIADVARNVSRLDAAMLDSSMQHILPNFDVLAAPDTMERGMEVSAERVNEILMLVEANYDYVVVNLGRSIDLLAVRAIDHATWVVPVMQLSVPAIRDARRVVATLDTLGVDSKLVHLVANRVDRRCDIDVGDVERTLGRTIEISIPNEYQVVSRSENQGVPLAKIDGRNAVVRALRALIERMPGCAPRIRNGWFSGLLGNGSGR
jgi:pilus assembly protein CpaE